MNECALVVWKAAMSAYVVIKQTKHSIMTQLTYHLSPECEAISQHFKIMCIGCVGFCGTNELSISKFMYLHNIYIYIFIYNIY